MEHTFRIFDFNVYNYKDSSNDESDEEEDDESNQEEDDELSG